MSLLPSSVLAFHLRMLMPFWVYTLAQCLCPPWSWPVRGAEVPVREESAELLDSCLTVLSYWKLCPWLGVKAVVGKGEPWERQALRGRKRHRMWLCVYDCICINCIDQLEVYRYREKFLLCSVFLSNNVALCPHSCYGVWLGSFIVFPLYFPPDI